MKAKLKKELRQNGFVIRMCVNCTTRIILSCTRLVVTILLFMKYIIPQNCLDNFEAGNNKNTERPQFQAMMDVADLFMKPNKHHPLIFRPSYCII